LRFALNGFPQTVQRSLMSHFFLCVTTERGRRKFARDLRIRLWQEHLGLTPAELPLIDDPLAGLAQWDLRLGKLPAQARSHVRPEGADVVEWGSIVDPDGTR
jgi:hypothetical protein